MRIIIEEIAKATGFSVPTVSRALTDNDYPVNPQTRSGILVAAEAMGYQPNLLARSLRTDRTNTIGIIVYSPLPIGSYLFVSCKGYKHHG